MRAEHADEVSNERDMRNQVNATQYCKVSENNTPFVDFLAAVFLKAFGLSS